MTEKFDPTKYGGVPYDGDAEEDTATSGLSPEEEEELRRLEAMKPAQTGLTADEEEELRRLGAMAPNVAPTAARKPKETGDLEQGELQDIADASGVTVDYLRGQIPFLAGVTGGYEKDAGMEGLGRTAGRVAGEVTKQAALGIPQKLYILSRDRNERGALDQLRALIQEKRTTGQMVAEVGLGLAIPGGVIARGAKTVAGRVLAGAATGATYGATSAATGEEATPALIGGAVGGVLTGAIVGIPAAWKYIPGAKDGAKRLAAREAEIQRLEERAAEAMVSQEDDIASKAALLSRPGYVDEIARSFKDLRQSIADVSKESVQLRGPAKAEALAKKALLQEELMAKSAEIEEVRDFAGYLSNKRSESAPSFQKAGTILSDSVRRERDFVSQEYRQYREVLEFERVSQDSYLAQVPTEATWGRRVKEAIVDGTVVGRWIDRRVAGSRMTVAMDKMAVDKRKYDMQTVAILSQAKLLKDSLKKSGADESLIYKVLDNVNLLLPDGQEAAIKMGLTPAQSDAAIGVRRAFESLRKDASELGFETGELSAYIPHIRVSAPETIRRINKQAIEAGIDISDPRTTEGLDKLITEYQTGGYGKYLNAGTKPKNTPEGLEEFVAQNPALTNVLRAVEYISGAKVTTPLELGISLRKLQSPEGLDRLGISESKRAMHRTLDLPDFIREKNVSKLLLNWGKDVYKHIYFRDGISELQKIKKLAMVSNDRPAADYIERLVQDLTGLREGTGLEWSRRNIQKFQILMKKKADAAPENSGTRMLWETLGESPEIFSVIASQVYPNLIGLSARAVLSNLSSPFTMAIPELGTVYGTKVLLAAGLRSVNTIRAGRELKLGREMAAYLNAKKYGGRVGYFQGEVVTFSGVDALSMVSKNRGYMGPQYSSELLQAVEGGVKEGALYSMAMGKVEQWNSFAMYAFEKSETVIRSLMGDAGEQVALDLLKGGSKGALKFIESMDRGYRSQVQKALDSGNERAVVTLVQDYLLSRTMFNYDRISMNEFGRSMGPLFSVFSKWPSVIAGNVMDHLEEKGALGGSGAIMKKYLGPMMFLMMLDKMAEEMELSPEKSDVSYRLLGKEGFSGMAPIRSINPFLEGKMVRPPVIDALATGLIATSSADPKAIWKWANDTAGTFVPGAGMVRFLTDDIPVFLGEDRIKGPMAERVYKRVTGDR